MISVSVTHRQGDFVLDAAFEAGEGVTSLFGPSGSGKTTLVQVIAGLLRPERAKIIFDGTVWEDTAANIRVPPHRRRIGYVFQEGRLFPHLTAQQNLRYGRFFAPRGAKLLSEDEVISLLGIGHLLDQRPRTLSGGEKQRVAIGRALLAAPSLILMDEPLSALDRARKQEILPYIERIRDEIRLPIIYVSHAVEEVARLSNRVILLDEGRVGAAGTPAEVFPDIAHLPQSVAPRSVLEGRIVGHEPGYHLSIAEIGAQIVTLNPVGLAVGAPVRITIPAEDVVVSLRRPEDISALNCVSATVTGIQRDAAHVTVIMDCEGQLLLARVTLLSADRLALRPGLEVFALFKAGTPAAGSLYQPSPVSG